MNKNVMLQFCSFFLFLKNVAAFKEMVGERVMEVDVAWMTVKVLFFHLFWLLYQKKMIFFFESARYSLHGVDYTKHSFFFTKK